MISDVVFDESLLGCKVIPIPTDELFEVLPKKVLFEARWGFSKGNLSDSEYKSIIDNKAVPALESLVAKEKQNPIIDCKAVYGFFPVISNGNKIIVSDNTKFLSQKDILKIDSINQGKTVLFEFPRQRKEPYYCISDFVNQETGDLIAFFAVTIGSKIIEAEKKLFEENAYYDYHLLHGLGAELADCAAVCIHKKICCELFPETYNKKDKPLGCRYSFGYPSCPDLSDQKKLFELLEPSKIGLNLTESYQMVPELSVSGFVIFNKKACYFVP